MSPPPLASISVPLSRQAVSRNGGGIYSAPRSLFDIITSQDKNKFRPDFAGRTNDCKVAKLYPNLKGENDRGPRGEAMEVEWLVLLIISDFVYIVYIEIFVREINILRLCFYVYFLNKTSFKLILKNWNRRIVKYIQNYESATSGVLQGCILGPLFVFSLNFNFLYGIYFLKWSNLSNKMRTSIILFHSIYKSILIIVEKNHI